MSKKIVIGADHGAFELKAKYQRNFLLGTIAMASFVALILFTFWGIII